MLARERGPENAYPDRLPARQSLRTFVIVAKEPQATSGLSPLVCKLSDFSSLIGGAGGASGVVHINPP